MKLRGLITAMVVLSGAHGGSVLVESSSQSRRKQRKRRPRFRPKFCRLSKMDISKIDLKKKDADEIVLANATTGNGTSLRPRRLGADQSAVSSMLSTLSSLNSDRLGRRESQQPEPVRPRGRGL